MLLPTAVPREHPPKIAGVFGLIWSSGWLGAERAAPSEGHAERAKEAGIRIAKEVRERQKGFGNFAASLTMILRSKRGQESWRELCLKVIEA